MPPGEGFAEPDLEPATRLSQISCLYQCSTIYYEKHHDLAHSTALVLDLVWAVKVVEAHDMADTLVTGLPTPPPSIIRPRFKLSELPVARDKRIAIDNLSYAFKKKGGFDSLRKKIWAEFTSSDGKENLTSRICEAAEAEIDQDPKILSRERGTAATLIEGAVDRRGAYKDVESEIDQLLATHVDHYLEILRSIRKAEVGEEKAAEEERIGGKTDEDYAKEFEAKAAEREKNRAKLADLDRQMEEIKRKLMEAEEKKRREAQKKKEEDDRKKREAEEERRRVDRERRREEERKYEEQREKEREERRRRRREEEEAREEDYRRRREEKERDRERERERERDRGRERLRDRNHRDSPYRSSRYVDERKDSDAVTPKDKSASDDAPLDEKALDDIALELLLNESKALAGKSRPKHEFDFERAEASGSSGRKAAMVERLRRSDRSRERDSKRRDTYDDRRDRRRSRSRSRDRHRSSRADDDRRAEIESQKQKERQEREKEARAYLKGESQADAASVAGSHASQGKIREEGEYLQEPKSPSSSHRKSYRDDDRDRRHSYRERDEREESKRSRILRSASPFNIDRYVPGGGIHRSSRSKEGETDRDKERAKYRERDHERDRDRDRDDYKERRRDREVDRDDYKDRRRDGESYRSHERTRDRDRDRDRDRERDRDGERERERSRSPHRRSRDERYRDRREGGDNRDSERRRAAVPIDRYVPGR